MWRCEGNFGLCCLIEVAGEQRLRALFKIGNNKHEKEYRYMQSGATSICMKFPYSAFLSTSSTYPVLPVRLSPIIPTLLSSKMLTTLLPTLLLAAQAANGAILPHLYDGYSFNKPLPSSSKPCASSASLGGN